MNYAVQIRLRLIDFLLAEYGYINRNVLMTYFGIGSATATRDFKEYLKIAPTNMEYSSFDKVYKKTLKFKRVWE